MDMFPKRRRSSPTPGIEYLEARSLPSGVAVVVTAQNIPEVQPNDTADRAQQLGSSGAFEVTGTIDRNGVDVDWYSFNLDVASTVDLATTGGTLSLYNDAAGDFSDPLTSGGQRLLTQVTAVNSNVASIQRDLAAGTYYLALSGAGNLYFQPYVADSGLPGATGNYSLSIDSTPLDESSSDGPQLLDVTASPLAVRIQLCAALAFEPTVELFDSNGVAVAVTSAHQNVGQAEVRVLPAVPLAVGDYTAVVKDADGNVQLTTPFSVPAVFGSETGLEGNDTPATAVELGDLGSANLIQVAGAIGDDPYYQLVGPNLANYAGNDVDLYHFQITSAEPVGLRAEVFAGRIGSPLDAGISLYRMDPGSGHLVLVTGLNQSYNLTPGTTVPIPLYFDPAITAGLTAGDYYLAVSQGANTTSPMEKQVVGFADGLFDPEQAHSGQAGIGVGNYVVNLQVVPIPNPPQVTSVSLSEQQVLDAAPTEIHVQFSEYINLTELAFSAFQATSQSTLAGIFIRDDQGQTYFPRLTAFDAEDLEAHLSMLDRLPAGDYELHLSGSLGLTNVVGAPLVGNSPNGDYVVKFSVAQSDVGTAGNPRLWTHEVESEAATTPQQLGELFPRELQAGVEIVRNSTRDARQARDNSDEYQFTITQTQSYFFHLDGDHLPRDIGLSLFDQAGNPVSVFASGDGLALTTQLSAGEYILRVGDWPRGAAHSLDYHIDVSLQGNPDNAPPLWSGPAPAVGIRLAGTVSATPGGLPGGGGQPRVTPGVNPGVSNPGGSIGGGVINSPANSSSTSTNQPGYLSDRSGLSRITLPDNAGNLVIAIPNGGSQTGNGVGNVFRASRLISQGKLDRDVAAPGGLSGLADGLVGKSVSSDRASDRKLTAGRKLGNLIDSALAAKKDETKEETRVADDTKTNSQPDGTADQDVVVADPETPDGETVGSNGTPSDESGDKAKARELSEIQNRRLLEILSLDLKADQGPVIAVFAFDSNSMTDTAKTAETQQEVDIPRALKYADKVFAGGLGLLLSGLAAPRSSNSELLRSVHGKGSRTGGRRCPSRHPGAREDSVS